MGEMADDLISCGELFYIHRDKPSGPGLCPICGKKTMPRAGPHGVFFGCVGYPG